MKNSSLSHPVHLGGVIFNLIIKVLIDWERVATLISVRLKVLHPLVRMFVRGTIDLYRPAAQHLTGLFFLFSSLSLAFQFFSFHFLLSPLIFPCDVFICCLVDSEPILSPLSTVSESPLDYHW